MNKLKQNSFTLLVGICVFLLSIYIAPYYTDGDQAKYTFTYNGLANMGLAEGYDFYFGYTGGREYLYYFIVWVASGFGLDKNAVMAFSNALLAALTLRLFIKWRVSAYIGMVIIFTNYYMLVLYFAAERLKFGILFLVVSLLFANSKKKSYAAAAMGVMSHFQVLLMYVSLIFYRLATAALYFFKSFRFSIKGLTYLLLLLIAVIFFATIIQSDYFTIKLTTYSEQASGKGISDLLRISVFLIASLWYSANKKETISFFIPMFVAALIVGADRVNMFGYFVFLYYGVRYKRGLNLGVLVTTLYFAWKGYYFIDSILEYGYGYAHALNQQVIIPPAEYA